METKINDEKLMNKKNNEEQNINREKNLLGIKINGEQKIIAEKN